MYSPPLNSETEARSSLLRVRNLTKAFGDFRAVDGLDLKVDEGEIYGFLGVNGAGKTTTIRMLMGILAPDEGSIELFGKTARRTSLKQKQNIGYVSQEQVFYPWMTARMLGRFVGGLYPNWDRDEFERILGVLEVPPDRKTANLSGGMRVKLALALALAPRPSLLILDEPTAGMDPVARREFLEIIEHQAREYGRTTFFSTHLLDEVERVADRVGIIHRGRTRFEGDLSLLQNRVQKVEMTSAQPIPEGFEVWKVEEKEDRVTAVVDGDIDLWHSSGLTGEKLSLDDIFISCVGIEAAKL